MGLSDALSSKGRKKGGIPTTQFDGMKLAKSDVADLYALLGLPEEAPGAQAFETIVATAIGSEAPEREDAAAADGSKFIGKKLSLAKTEEDDEFTSHAVLCEQLGIPATSQGSQVFREALEKAISNLRVLAGVAEDVKGEAAVQAIIAWRKSKQS